MASTVIASREIGRVRVEVLRDDIASQPGIDAVVNPTNSALQSGGGVSGAIFSRADAKALAAACSALAPLEIGCAVATLGFGLPSQHIIHCHGPKHGFEDSEGKLEETYWNVFSLAERSKFSSLAVPAISAGAFGFPIEDSARVAVEVIKAFSPDFLSVRLLRLIVIDDAAAKAYSEELLKPVVLPEWKEICHIETRYSIEEFDVIRQGRFGDHDTKWFFYFEAPWLCVYRGNRKFGRCYFWLRFQVSDKDAVVDEGWYDNEESMWTPEKASELIGYLLDDRFALLWVSCEKASVGGAEYWVKRGKVALVSSFGEGDGLLSSSQTKELGRRLIEAAESLNVTNHSHENVPPIRR
jgi:O-acetyl-ADP-ribose deacetylase (regulator of RNase III)